MRRIQTTIDRRAAWLLRALAAPRTGNKGFVVRETMRRLAEQEGFEQYLDWLEQQPAATASLQHGLAYEGEGRTVAHEAEEAIT